MQKFVLIILAAIVLFLAGQSHAAETNQVTTNQVQSAATSTNAVRSPSDPELQAAARQVMQKIVIFGILALGGAVVVAGFAMYGAYRKFGVPGLVVVGIIVVVDIGDSFLYVGSRSQSVLILDRSHRTD